MQLSLVLMTLRRAQADTEMTLQPGQARAGMRRHRRMLAYLSRTQTTRLALAALQVAKLLAPAQQLQVSRAGKKLEKVALAVAQLVS